MSLNEKEQLMAAYDLIAKGVAIRSGKVEDVKEIEQHNTEVARFLEAYPNVMPDRVKQSQLDTNPWASN